MVRRKRVTPTTPPPPAHPGVPRGAAKNALGARGKCVFRSIPGQHEQEQRHAQVRRGRVHPDAERQRVEEPEQLRFLLLRFRVQYAYAQRHERRREVHRGPPVERDGQIAYGQIRPLRNRRRSDRTADIDTTRPRFPRGRGESTANRPNGDPFGGRL